MLPEKAARRVEQHLVGLSNQRGSIVAAKTLLNFLEQRLQGVAGKLQLVLDGELRALELKASPVCVWGGGGMSRLDLMYLYIGCPAAGAEHNDLISLLTTVSAPRATVAASHAAANWATASASGSGSMTVFSAPPSSFAKILILGSGQAAPQRPLTAWEPLATGVASWRSMRMRALACSLLSFSAKTLRSSKSSSKRKLTAASVLVSSLVFCKHNQR